jgi:hypothetical protein
LILNPPPHSEDTFGHLYLLTAATATGKGFDLHCYRATPHLKDFRIAAHLVSDEDWALKAHRCDGDSGDSTIGASDGKGAAGEIHLRQKPAVPGCCLRKGKAERNHDTATSIDHCR